jgi:hypothetical protein
MIKNFARTQQGRFAGLGSAAQFVGALAVVFGMGALLHVTQHANGSQQSQDVMLAECLRYLRTQICVYSLDHNNIPPGFRGNDLTQLPDAQTFVDQMSQYTDIHGRTSMRKTDTRDKGPYLAGVPANPMTLRNGVLVVIGDKMPRPDESKPYGWIYNPATRQISANVGGADSHGVSYASY